MKILQIIAAAALLTLSCTLHAQEKDSREAQVTFSVNITCANCEQKIKKTIPFEKGVRDLTTSLAEQKVTVVFRSDKTDPARLKKAIEKLGYTCTELQPAGGSK